MESGFDFINKLDFSDVDLMAPEKVFEDILAELKRKTSGIIQGKVSVYTGYVKSRFGAFLSSFAKSTSEDLGSKGEENNLFEFYLSTECYQKYKFRVCFFEYGLSRYPVHLIVEDGIADDINLGEGYDNEFTCNTKDDLSKMIFKILNTKRAATVMQELIRINQIYKSNPQHNDNTDAMPF